MSRKIALVGTLVAAHLAAGCAVGDPQDLGSNEQGVKDNTQVEIIDVGYGGTTIRNDGDRVILPEFIVLFNFGNASANIGDWYLTDGNSWTGDGMVRFPRGTVIPAGAMLVVANYPPPTYLETNQGYRQITFEDAYGYAPDMEIAGWDPEIEDLAHVIGRIRLKHRQCTYDAECWDVQETVGLMDGSHIDEAEAIQRMNANEFNDEAMVSVFPEQ